MTFELLLQAGLADVLFYLNKVKEAKISVIKEALDITQHSLYSSIEKLDDNGLIIDDKQPTQRIIRITEKGEDVSKKLSLVFDESVKVFPIPKEQVKVIEKACEFEELKVQGIETWQAFVKQAISEKLKEFKEGKLLT